MSSEFSVQVEGMTCAACTRRVQKALERVEGVQKVSVDLVRERALIGGSAVDLAALSAAAEQAGYKVRLPDAPKPASPAGPRLGRAGLAFAIAALLTALPFAVEPSWPRAIVELTLGSLVTFGLGRSLFVGAWHELAGRVPGMNFLVASGAAAAMLLFGMNLFAMGEHAGHGMAHSDAASAATIIAFVLVGRFLEARARHQVAAALENLDSPLDAVARVMRHGSEGDVQVDDLRIGDVVLVPPHGVVPADGVVLPDEDGESPGPVRIEMAWLTGESRPVVREVGTEVQAGAVNTSRPFRLKVRAVGEQTHRAQIASLVSGALSERPPLLLMAERWSARVVPLVLTIAGATLVVLLAMGEAPMHALTRAVTVLVIACPCALGLATPTAIAASLGAALRAGILVASPSQLDALAGVKTVVFDKTGTLTEGRARPVRIEARNGDAGELLRIAAAVETESEHPLGRAIFEEAMRRGLTLPNASEVSSIDRGLCAQVEGARIEVGAMATADETDTVVQAREDGASIVEIKRDGEPLGWMAIADALRSESRSVVAELGREGISVRLLSGDDARAASARGLEVGLPRDHIEGGLSPDDKRERLRALSRDGDVAMVGDGINDGPALASAAVGIAIAHGAKLAMQTAGITLEHGLTRLVPARKLAQRTRSIIRQNLAMAFAYNVVALPLAAFGALDAIGGPSTAALAMACSSIAVVLSSTRLTRRIA